ncbi:MAG: ribokinase [Chloroflexi bacterium]|nr:ribokinase [Chloroflexota bacterium]
MTTLETRIGGKIVVVGGLNMDLFIQGERLPNPGETFEGRSFATGGGGKGGNQAVGVARLSGRRGTAMMIGQVGDDAFGRELVSDMESEGISCEFTRTDMTESSGVALIFIDDTAENYVLPVYGANATCGPQQVEDFRSIVGETAVLLVQQEISMDVTLECMRVARDAGVTIVLDPAPVRGSQPKDFLSMAHVITPNQHEAEALTGVPVRDVKSAEKAALELRKRGTPVAVVKLGEDGAYVASVEFEGYFPAFKVTPVATVGAGDAFNAGLAVGLTEGLGIQDAMWLAMASGAVCVSHEGAQESMGRRPEVDKLLKTRPR